MDSIIESYIDTRISIIKGVSSGDFREVSTKLKRYDYEIICKNQFLPDSSKLTLIIISTLDIYDKIIKIMIENPVIDKIFIIRENNTFCIWTSLSKYDKESRYSLYAKELEIIKYFFPVEFHFDFHLAEADDVEELLASGAKRIYSKTQK